MFEALPASYTAAPPRARIITSALLCHAVLIAVAIKTTAAPGVAAPELPRDTIRVDLAPPQVQQERPRSALAESGLPSAPRVPELSADPPQLGLPQLSVARPGTAASLAGPFASSTRSLHSPDSSQSWFPSTEVDELPQLLTDPDPEYPDVLRRAGVSGTVEVEYVVGTDGLIESRSIRVLRTDHDRFTTAVVQALGRARFKAARRAGRAVAVLVRQTIRFRSEMR